MKRPSRASGGAALNERDCGPVPRVGGYYLAITPSAMTMSPFIGIAVADDVMRNQHRSELTDFRPSRFFN